MTGKILKPITVEYSRKAIEEFKARAKRAHPRETYGILIGTDETSGRRHVVAQEVFYPDGADKFCSKSCIDIQDIWFVDAEHYADEAGLEVVGDIHSHPGISPDRSRSEGDLDYSRWDRVEAICKISECRNGRLVASVRFWGPTPPVEASAV